MPEDDVSVTVVEIQIEREVYSVVEGNEIEVCVLVTGLVTSEIEISSHVSIGSCKLALK